MYTVGRKAAAFVSEQRMSGWQQRGGWLQGWRVRRSDSELGQTESSRVREVEFSVGQKLLDVITKGVLVCYTFVGIKFSGF